MVKATKVGIVGYGVIGRRVADAVRIQRDMELVGIVKVKPDYKARVAVSKGIDVYAINEGSLRVFETTGLAAKGTLEDMLEKVDVVIDASPDGTGKKNDSIYSKLGIRRVFQGGEDHDVSNFSFVAQVNYEQALGREKVRVVSCNTTALCRVLWEFKQNLGLEKARAVIVRRATDPDDPSKGPIDSVVLDPVRIPSHHADDVKTVIPDLDVVTMAVKVPTTHMHVHCLTLKTGSKVKEEDVVSMLESSTRISVFSSSEGFKSTSQLVDYARESGRVRGDLYEVAVWREGVRVYGDEVYMFIGVHQESIVVPENIDAVRALVEGASKEESIRATNESLGIKG